MDGRIGETPVMRSNLSRGLVIGYLLATGYRGLVACQLLVGSCAPLPYGKCFLGLLYGQRIYALFARS